LVVGDYTVLFILGISALVLLIAGAIHKSHVLSNQVELADRARRRRLKEKSTQAGKSKGQSGVHGKSHVISRELKRTRTPWGWPQQDGRLKGHQRDGEFTESLRRFADRLIDSKKTKEDRVYLAKRDASLRALLEDRYGRASRMRELKYREVKAPLLRDPGQPFDQTDGMPSWNADRVALGLGGRESAAKGLAPLPRTRLTSSALKDLKMPWGW
jgi:hypothetical protein